MRTNIEIIVSTYNNPSALHLALGGLYHQNFKDFDICIADDGSGAATKELVDQWKVLLPNRLRHEWIPDQGFNKNTVLNLSVKSSRADYLIFTDGDCIAWPDFVERHVSLKRLGQYLCGGLVRLSNDASQAVNLGGIKDKSIFQQEWLDASGCCDKFKTQLKAGYYPKTFASAMEFISPVKRTWNGANASTWREHLMAVNGFDESMKYGAEDIEIGFRLNNMGITGRSVRYSARLLHLEHERPYANNEAIRAGKKYAHSVRAGGLTWASSGIRKI